MVGRSVRSLSLVRRGEERRTRGGAARLGSVDFASHRRRLASGLTHGLVLAPGAQGGCAAGL